MQNYYGWLLKALAAIGGWNVLEKLILPLIKSLYANWREKHDQPVWAVVRQPRYKVVYWVQGVAMYDNPPQELPYTASEISERVKRKEESILQSLKRLEKRGKVKDVHGGWIRV